uniref:Reverse transcriptase domain-containing protein n=1 Tax=Chenopodium quinoa TaxID=63459 RepID=A0A803LFV0_CHEQI
MPRILCANRTTPRIATGQNPFSLVYGCEAVLTAEVTSPTTRYGLLTLERNTEELSHDLDTIEERRDLSYIRMATYQQTVARNFTKNVKAKMFKVGDWFLRKVFQNTKELNVGKMGENWEGPYQIDKEMLVYLEKKFDADDAGKKKYVIGNWLNFKLVDSKPIIDQVHVYENYVAEIHAQGIKMCEIVQANVLIEKSPDS